MQKILESIGIVFLCVLFAPVILAVILAAVAIQFVEDGDAR